MLEGLGYFLGLTLPLACVIGLASDLKLLIEDWLIKLLATFKYLAKATQMLN
jgi:hypothetical protein